jgi:glycosyltransferase involved in cell wall biosynthesis
MRITFVLPDLNLTGGTRVLAEYASRLRARGHDVLVVSTPLPATPLQRRVKSLLRGEGWPRQTKGPSHFDGKDIPIRELNRHRDVTDADVPDADVVVATWWATAAGVASLSARKGVKFIFSQGYEVLPGERNPDIDSVWRMPLRKIVVSRWLAELARTRFGDNNVAIVPNAVDSSQFYAPPRARGTPPTVGFVYSTCGFKNCAVIHDAVELARQRIPALRIVSFGVERPDRSLSLPLGCEFEFRPSPDRLRELYASCDGWLWAGNGEGFGLPLLEAMACRTPVIATPSGAAPELLAEGGGVLVKPESPSDMADAIVRLCGLPESAWRAMSDAALATATRYTWDDATGLFEAALCAAVTRAERGEVAGRESRVGR